MPDEEELSDQDGILRVAASLDLTEFMNFEDYKE